MIKAGLVIGLLVAMDLFVRTVRTAQTVDAARMPLAALFLWVQVLHAFDVPRRRDLAFSMVSSTTLVAAAAVLSLTTGFAGILLAWAALSAAWLWLSAQPRPDEMTAPVSVRRIAAARPPRLAAARSAGSRRHRGDRARRAAVPRDAAPAEHAHAHAAVHPAATGRRRRPTAT